MPTLLDDITSGDAQRIWSSSCAIAQLRDAAQLDALSRQLAHIKSKTQGVALGGALFANSGHLNFALAKLEYVAGHTGCLCALYPSYLFFNPTQEQEAGNVRIVSKVSDANSWNSNFKCQCLLCDTMWSVEEGEYHYTWWQWSLASSR